MSLNWKEIDCILSELSLKGSIVRNIYQPTYHKLILELYNQGKNFRLLIALETGMTRIHTISNKPKNPHSPPRFVSFLRSHIKNGRIKEVYQVGMERIIKFVIERYEEEYFFWVRLWGGAANIIVTDSSGKILDAHYRRPGRNEISGGYYNPEKHEIEVQNNIRKNKERIYVIRDFPGEGNFNDRVENYYRQLEEKKERERITKSLAQLLDTRENRLLSLLDEMEKKKKDSQYFTRYKEYGDIIMSSLHKAKKGDTWLEAEDFFHDNQRINIQLDEKLSPAENAEKYYKKYKKFRKAIERFNEEIDNIKKNLKIIQEKRKILEAQNTDLHLLRELKRMFDKKIVQNEKTEVKGYIFNSKGFTIRVGKNARENDELLRKYARGNDFWFHARDYPGSYVFVRSKPGKSLPLDVMLDAANLALYYSKRKNSGEGDVYYTRVKYLRRMKNGKTGLVIPTREKNLHIKLDLKRIDRLKEFF